MRQDRGTKEDLFGPVMTNDEHSRGFSVISRSNSTPTRRSLQSFRTSRGIPYSYTERRASVSLVSPFKSPSLSFSPQAELLFSSRSQRSLNGRKTEFSSSFERFLKNNSFDSGDSTRKRRGSRASDCILLDMECKEDYQEEEEGLEDFMKFIGAQQELKMFQRTTTKFMIQNKENYEPTRQPLSHFRHLQESHNVLSESMSFSEPKEPLNSYGLKEENEFLGHQVFYDHPRCTLDQVQHTTISPLKNRKTPPLPPPIMPQCKNNSSIDDDDSLVFRMSELGGYEDHSVCHHSKHETKQKARQNGSLSFSNNSVFNKKTNEQQGTLLTYPLFYYQP
ncbi:uncharacterized protein B0P05DRAFT_527936 [Gilbertella persicaria]|uniref:uncharacterized protein n=1 Tax=Gilbertella persicaria TaxID=101096 RepID=UPI00221EA7BF|nr:uncharacterized protein B0P05DRAFT_527936 [Gilbertella persicaria]KAI8090912.1 hypothetical protein B0P05DRAFT_527936 [Gilbertella persicaria]